MKEKNKKKYTLIFIPDDKSRPISFKVNGSVIKMFVVIFILFGAGLAILLFQAGDIAVRLQLTGALREENLKLKEQNRKLLAVTEKISSIERLSAYLRHLATVTEKTAGQSPAGVGAEFALEENPLNDSNRENISVPAPYPENDGERESIEESSPELLLGSIPNIRPVEGWITRTYNITRTVENERHPGVDFAAAKGTLIRATAPGTVDAVSNDRYFGLVVTVKHTHGFETRYGHCKQILVSRGDAVERGQTIALVGNTGQSTGPHLHYEVLRNGQHMDPVKFMLSHAVIP